MYTDNDVPQLRISGRFERGRPPNALSRSNYSRNTTNGRELTQAEALYSFFEDKSNPVKPRRSDDTDFAPHSDPHPSDPYLVDRVYTADSVVATWNAEVYCTTVSTTAEDPFLTAKSKPLMPRRSFDTDFSPHFETHPSDPYLIDRVYGGTHENTREVNATQDTEVEYNDIKYFNNNTYNANHQAREMIEMNVLISGFIVTISVCVGYTCLVYTAITKYVITAIYDALSIQFALNAAYNIIKVCYWNKIKISPSSNDCVSNHIDCTQSRPTDAKKIAESGLRTPFPCLLDRNHGAEPTEDEIEGDTERVTATRDLYKNRLQLQAAMSYDTKSKSNLDYCPRPVFDSVLPSECGILSVVLLRPTSYPLALPNPVATLAGHFPFSITESASETEHGTTNKYQQDVSLQGNSSSNSTGSFRNRVSSRPSLRRSRGNATGQDEDDDDDENWRRNNTTPTGPQSTCRTNAPPLLPPATSVDSDSDSSTDIDYESDSSLAIMRGVANHPNQTVLGGISRIIGGLGRGLYSFSLFGAQPDDSLSDTSFALNVSIEHAVDSPNGSSNPLISSTKLSSPALKMKQPNSGLFLQVTPIRGKSTRKRTKSESNRDYNQAYYKPPSKLVRERAKLKVEADLMRQRSFSDPQPYAPHDSAFSDHEISFLHHEELEELSKIVKPGISDTKPVPSIVVHVPEGQSQDQDLDATFSGLANPDISPVSSRRRKNSLSLSPRSSKGNKSPCSQPPKNTMSCVHISEDGYHELRCSAMERCLVHLEQSILDDEAYDKAIIFSAVEKVLFKSFREIGSPSSVNPLQQSVTLSWKTDEVLAAAKPSLPPKVGPTTEDSSINVDNCLLQVLAELNRHAWKLARTNDQLDVVYNGLSITSMIDRNTRHPVNKLVDISPKYPLITMHLGLERSVDAIPKKFGSNLNEVYTISLGNFYTLSILPEAQESYRFTLPAEGSGIGHSDFHVYLSPTIEIQPECESEQIPVPTEVTPSSSDLDVTVIEVSQSCNPSGEAVDNSTVEVTPVDSIVNTDTDNSSVVNPSKESIPAEAPVKSFKEPIPTVKPEEITPACPDAFQHPDIDGTVPDELEVDRNTIPVQARLEPEVFITKTAVELEKVSGDNKAAEEQLVDNNAAEKQTVDINAAEEQQVDNNVSGEQTVDNLAVDNQPVEENAAEEQQVLTNICVSQEESTTLISEPFLHMDAHIRIINSRKGGQIKI